jgi:hypothetical protein
MLWIAMKHSASDSALESMQQFASDMNKFKRQSFSPMTHRTILNWNR